MLDPRQELYEDWCIANAPSLMTTQDWRNAGMDIEHDATLAAEAEHYATLARDEALDAMEARGGPDYLFDDGDEIPF